MASNEDLRTQILELDENAEIDGLKNKELAALLSGLKAVVTAEPEPVVFHMAPGKAITSKKGILAEGDEVKAEYFNGGEATLKHFVKAGYILEG